MSHRPGAGRRVGQRRDTGDRCAVERGGTGHRAGGSRSLLLRGAMPLALATGHCRRTRDGRDSDSLADRSATIISHGTLNRSSISVCSSRKLSSLRPTIRGLAWYDAAKRRADALPKPVEAPVTSTHEFLIDLPVRAGTCCRVLRLPSSFGLPRVNGRRIQSCSVQISSADMRYAMNTRRGCARSADWRARPLRR